MYTRIIENHAFSHLGVEKAVLRAHNGKSLIFDAYCITRLKGGNTSGPDMFNEKAGIEGERPRTLQIDVEREDIFRVRFADSSSVPDNSTPMVSGDFGEGGRYSLLVNEGQYTIDTGSYRLVITAEPYRMEIFDRRGVRKLRASGGDDNHFKPLDAPNLGIVRGGSKPMEGTFPHGSQYEYLSDGIKATIAVESFELHRNEHIYGLGENFIGLDKRYQTIDLWTQDGLGNMSRRTYKPIPFFVSSRGYGIYVNSHAPMTFWFGSLSNIRTILSVEEGFMDYYIVLGETMKHVIAGYNDITGHVPLPPKWSFGFWLSKYTYYSDTEATEVVEKMRENRLPFDVLHLDVGWFDKEWVCDLEFSQRNFPDPAGFARRMKSKGIHLSLWQMPYIDERNRLFKEARDRGFFLEDREYLAELASEENPELLKEGFDNYHRVKWGTFDVSNPEFAEWFKEKIRKLYRMGYDVIKTDFGEGAPTLNAKYCNGISARKMHNAYPLFYNTLVFDTAREFSDRPIVWSRSTWAGCQRYPIHWGGDPTAIYENLIPQLTGGLSFMFSGFYFWSHDMGSLSVRDADKELYMRWFQQGLFTTHPRNHGGGKVEPFHLEAGDIHMAREMLNLRYRLIPYIYSCAYESVRSKVPLMRPMPLEFEDDHNVHSMDDQFMFGPSLLVAPVYSKGGSRDVYLPEGVWYDFWSGERLQGGKWYSIRIGVDRIPLYLRGGAIIPMGPVMQYIGEKPCDPIDLLVVPAGDSSFLYYDDTDTFTVGVSERKITIDDAQHHCFSLQVYTPDIVSAVLVNGKSCPFTLESWGFRVDCGCRTDSLMIEWVE